MFAQLKYEKIALCNGGIFIMTIKIRVFSDLGQQMEENQDAFSILMDEKMDEKSAIVALCDGVGGHSKAKETATFVSKAVIKEMKNSKLSLDQIFKIVNQEVISNDYGNTTLAVVDINLEKQRILFGNSGDTRIYLINNKVEQLSIDHTTQNQLMSNGFEKGMAIFFRKLTSCFGKKEKMEFFVGEKVLDEDSLLVLASDGGWELLEARGEWERIVQFKTTKEREDYLFEQMEYLKKQSDDNITIISISFSIE